MDYRSLFFKLEKYIQLLVDGKIFSAKKEYKEMVISLVQEITPLFLFLADETFRVREANELLERFNSIYGLEESTSSSAVDYSEKEEYEIKDEINYLRVCVKNISGFDLDETNLAFLKKEEEKIVRYSKKPDAVTVFRNILNEDFDTDSSSKVNKIFDDLVLKTHAYDRLNRDIRDGSIYIYKTKPKRNVFIKYFLSGIFSTGACFSFLHLILLFFDSTWSATSTLLSVFSIVYSCWNLSKLKNCFKNDNFKYSFPKKSFYFILFFSVAWFAIVFSNYTELDPSNPLQTNPDICFSIVTLTILVNFIVYSISYWFFQPEKDKQLIDEVLEKHISDLSKDVSFK